MFNYEDFRLKISSSSSSSLNFSLSLLENRAAICFRPDDDSATRRPIRCIDAMLLDVILFPSSLLSFHCLTTEGGGGREQRGARNFLRAWARDARLGKQASKQASGRESSPCALSLLLPPPPYRGRGEKFSEIFAPFPEKLFPFTVHRSNFPSKTRKGFEGGGGGGGGCGETDLTFLELGQIR